MGKKRISAVLMECAFQEALSQQSKLKTVGN
jgi:hypothetical protein